MHEHGPRSPARLLAPLALVLFAVAVAVIVLSAGSGGDDSSDASADRPGSSAATTTTTPQPRRSTYIVKTGDTLNAISEKTGVPVERIEELNPDLDPQALLSGQRITLRE
jgi:LysM repeat protein